MYWLIGGQREYLELQNLHFIEVARIRMWLPFLRRFLFLHLPSWIWREDDILVRLWSLCSRLKLLGVNLEPLVAAWSLLSLRTRFICVVTFWGLFPATAERTEQMSELFSLMWLFLRVATRHQYMHKYIGQAAAHVFRSATVTPRNKVTQKSRRTVL